MRKLFLKCNFIGFRISEMNMLRIILISAVTIAMLACSSGSKKGMETLGSLENRKVKINPQDLPSANKVDAKKRYQEFAQTTKNQELRAAAMERLADIHLETQQNEKIRDAELKEAEMRARKGADTAVVDTTKFGDYADVAAQYEKLLKRYPNSKDNEKKEVNSTSRQLFTKTFRKLENPDKRA